MRILRKPLAGRGDADLFKQIDCAVAGRCAGDLAMAQQRFLELVADGVGWIQRSHWLLENRRHAVAADIGHLALRQLGQINSVEGQSDRCALRPFGQQIHYCERGQRLAATRFTHNAKRLAAPDRKTDIANRVEGSDSQGNSDIEARNFEKCAQLRFSGAVKSRTPSPSRLIPSTSTNSAAARRIPLAISMVAMMMMTLRTLGSISLATIRQAEQPTAWAAAT